MDDEQVDWDVEEEALVVSKPLETTQDAGDYDDEDAVSLAPSDDDHDQPYVYQGPPTTQDNTQFVYQSSSQRNVKTTEDGEREDTNGYSDLGGPGGLAPTSPVGANELTGRSSPPQASHPTTPAVMIHALPPKPQTSPSAYTRNPRLSNNDHHSDPSNRSSTTRNLKDRRLNGPPQHASDSRSHNPNDLPPGWERKYSSGSPREVYYYHRESNHTQWEHPRNDQDSRPKNGDISSDDQRRLSTSRPPEKRIEPEYMDSFPESSQSHQPDFLIHCRLDTKQVIAVVSLIRRSSLPASRAFWRELTGAA